MQRKRFNEGYSGRFRIDHGAARPFGLWSALNLEPLGFWDHCSKHAASDEQHFFLFDSERDGGFDFKAAGYECSINSNQHPNYVHLAEIIKQWKSRDPLSGKMMIDELSEPN